MSPTGRGLLAPLLSVMSLLAATILLATAFLGKPSVVVGTSMEPALRDGDRVIVDLWTHAQRRPHVGEVILFHAPAGGVAMVKRVARGSHASDGLWVLGDNADVSSDSRQWGPVALDDVIGRVAFRYWPPSRVGPVRGDVARTGFRLPER